MTAVIGRTTNRRTALPDRIAPSLSPHRPDSLPLTRRPIPFSPPTAAPFRAAAAQPQSCPAVSRARGLAL